MENQNEILFHPGLYANDEELNFFGVFTDNSEFWESEKPSETYRNLFYNKLIGVLENTYKSFISDSEIDYEEAVTAYCVGDNSLLEKIKRQASVDYSENIDYYMKEYFHLGVYSYEISNADFEIAADLIMDIDVFSSLLSDFTYKIKLIKNKESLKEYYIENGYIDEDDEIDENELGIADISEYKDSFEYDTFEPLASYAYERAG